VGKPESEQMLEHGIQAGKGGVYLKFTRGQFHDLAEGLSMPVDDLHSLVRQGYSFLRPNSTSWPFSPSPISPLGPL
jgi:hypothetical protein